jgi:hypothetical protein
LPKESENAGGQTYPSWAKFKAKYMARTNKVKPKPAEDNSNGYTTPTFDELKKKHEEEHLQEFFASLNKDRQDNTTQVGEIKSLPPRSEQVEPSAKLRQEEAMLIDSTNEEMKNSSTTMSNSGTEKAESKSTCVESIESKEASFVEQEHGKLSKAAMLDYYGCKGVYLLPYEFRAKEVDDHQAPENIAEQCLVDREHQSEESQDPEQQEYKALDNHQKGEQDIVSVMHLSRSSNVFKEVSLANNLLVFRFGQNYIVHTSISKFFIRNIKRPIMRRKLFGSSNKIVTNCIDQRVVPLRETDSNKLL